MSLSDQIYLNCGYFQKILSYELWRSISCKTEIFGSTYVWSRTTNYEYDNGWNTSAFRLAVINVCPVFVLRVASEYSFTDLGRMDSWVDCWLVVKWFRRWGSNQGQKTSQGSQHCVLTTRSNFSVSYDLTLCNHSCELITKLFLSTILPFPLPYIFILFSALMFSRKINYYVSSSFDTKWSRLKSYPEMDGKALLAKSLMNDDNDNNFESYTGWTLQL